MDRKRHEYTDVALSHGLDDEDRNPTESGLNIGQLSWLHIEKHTNNPVPTSKA
jgi:hypothetical protein